MPVILRIPRLLWRKAKRALHYASCVCEMHYRWHFGVRQKANPLPRRLVVSITSYPPRFATLARTLKCLLRQTVRPDEVVLWIAARDLPKLPENVSRLTASGLTIRPCDDLKSYKKIIPALQSYPDAYIVTSDDDFYIPPRWLEELVREYDPAKREVVCHRMHRVVLGADGLPLPYLQWQLTCELHKPCLSNFPTGGAGALFPPGAFHDDVLRSDLFLTLAPDADDLWLYWMLLLNRVPARKAGGPTRMLPWRGSQRVSLFNTNVRRNDVQIRNLIGRYGFPLRERHRERLGV